MTTFPPAALPLAGFALAHAAWSISDLPDEDLLCPLAILEDSQGGRRLIRFEAESQEQAITLGKQTLTSPDTDTHAWAFAREGSWRPNASAEVEDVLTVEFWAVGMSGPAAVLQPFERFTKHGRFRIIGDPLLTINGRMVEEGTGAQAKAAIEDGIMAHPSVADLWATWR